MDEIYCYGSKLHVWIGTAEEIREDLRQSQEEHNLDYARPEDLAQFSAFLRSKDIPSSRYPTPLTSASSRAVDADVLGAIEILQLLA